VQLKAIEIIVKFGDKRDLASLKKLMTNGTLSVKEAAAKAALILSPGINGIAHEFLGSGDSGLIIAALKSL
jgi:HEAT repeat protein